MFPANIQGWKTGVVGGSTGHVQLGYAITDCYSAPCNNGLPDNALRFVWTDTDTSGGIFEVASWAPIPTVGQDFRFTITASETVGGNPTWKFELRDMDTAQTWSEFIVRTWTGGADGGYKSWAGAEIIGSGSQIHRQAGSNLKYIGSLEYQSSFGGTWTNYPQNGCHWATTTDPNHHGDPSSSWAQCVQNTDASGEVQINVWTNSHDSW